MNHDDFFKFKLEKKDNTLIALIDNPPVNALCEDVFKELQEIVYLANNDDEIVSVVISSANEKKFTVGADLKERRKIRTKTGKSGVKLKFGA